MISYKGYLISPSKVAPKHFVVATEGRGGKIPNKLDGFFTHVGYVKNLIDSYVDSKPKKEMKDANKAEPTS